MYTKAYFENIRETIHKELQVAKTSIYIAVAWFTDSLLFNAVIKSCKDGVIVKIIINDDDINSTSNIKYNKVLEYGGTIKKIDISVNGLMHNKFCIIDNNTLISGSYNWTNKAKYNNESITIIRDNPQLISDFLLEFDNLLGSTNYEQSNQSSFDWTNVFYRVKAIKSLLVVKEYSIALNQLYKLNKEEVLNPIVNNFVADLTILIEKKETYKAVKKIDELISSKSSIQVFNDPEIHALRNEVSYLKAYIHILINRKSELLKTIQLFQIKHNEILGPITKKILETKIKLNKNNPKEKEKAENEYDRFKKNSEEVNKNKPKSISKKELIEIKKYYREASKLCHPDLVEEKFKTKANQVFIDLNTAYQNNDTLKVQKILKELKVGIFGEQHPTNKKRELIDMVNQMRNKIESIKMELDTIRNSETYIVINSLGDWDEYFEQKKKEAEEYLNTLTTS